MTRLLAQWVLNALSLMLVARIIPGIFVRSFGTAMLAAAVIALVNVTLGLLLKVLTFPLSIVTLGLFLLVINALMLKLAAGLVPGFVVRGFVPAFLGGLVLSALGVVIRELVGK